jgi:hypothetical protein
VASGTRGPPDSAGLGLPRVHIGRRGDAGVHAWMRCCRAVRAPTVILVGTGAISAGSGQRAADVQERVDDVPTRRGRSARPGLQRVVDDGHHRVGRSGPGKLVVDRLEQPCRVRGADERRSSHEAQRGVDHRDRRVVDRRGRNPATVRPAKGHGQASRCGGRTSRALSGPVPRHAVRPRSVHPLLRVCQYRNIGGCGERSASLRPGRATS